MRIVPLLLCLLVQASGLSQIAQAPVAGARSWAMGGTGLVFTDGLSAVSNQAGLGLLNAPTVWAGGDIRFSLPELTSGTIAVCLPHRLGGFALSASYFGSQTLNDTRFGLGYGRRFLPWLSVGLQFDYLRLAIPDNGNTHLFTFETGLIAQINDKFSTGVHLYSPIQIALTETQPIPTRIRAGIGWRPEKTVLTLVELEKDMDRPAGVRLGVEYTPVQALDIRMGLQSLTSRLSFGAGYRITSSWRVDVGADYHLRLGLTPAVTLLWVGKK